MQNRHKYTQRFTNISNAVSRRLLIGLILFALAGLVASVSAIKLSGRRAVAAFATQRYIAPGGADAGDCSTMGSPCLTLAYAIGQSTTMNDTINAAAGTYVLTSTVNVNKANLTISGAGSATTIFQVAQAVGNAFSINAAGVTLTDLQIEKTNVTGVHELILVNASGDNFTLQNSLIQGPDPGTPWSVNGIVSRALVSATGGVTGLLIQNNTIKHLRQPAYFNPGTVGTVSNNNVSGTRGWVVDGGVINFTGNTWGPPPNQGADIALLVSCNPADYPNLAAISNANSNAFISGQFVGASSGFGTVYVDDDAAPGGNGSLALPYQTINEGITGVLPNGTINVAAGTYTQTGSISLNKSVVLQGPNSAISPNGGTRVAEAIITGAVNPVLRISLPGNPVTIQGFKFDSTGVVDAYDPGLNITIRKNIYSNGTSNGAFYFLNAPPQLTIDDNHLTNAVTPDNDTIFVAGNWNGTTGTVATITNNIIENTPADNASGMNLSNVSGTISGNQFLKLRYYAILLANNSSSMTVSNNVFDGIVNPSPGTVPSWGAGVRTFTPSYTGPVNIIGNTFQNSYTGVGIRGVPNDPGASIAGMDINVNFNRFINNTYGISDGAAGTLDAENNWWGCNFGPGTGGAGCTGTPNGLNITGTAMIDADPWLTLTLAAAPATVPAGTNSTLTAKLVINSAGTDTSPMLMFVPNTTPVNFATGSGTVAPMSTTTTNGVATSTLTAGGTPGASGASVNVDGQVVSQALTIVAGPPASLAFVQQPTNAPPNIPITPSVTVQLKDAFSNNVSQSGVSITVSLSSGTGTLAGTLTQMTNASGLATFNNLSIDQPGVKQLTASGSSLTSAVSNNFTILSAPAIVYVDDNWIGTTLGADPDGAGPATIFGYDAFATVQNGVNGVATGGQVIVYAGTYIEDINVNRTMIVSGAGPTSILSGAIGGPGSTVAITASNVEFKGFKVTREGNTAAQWNDPNLNSGGVTIQGQAITGANIHDNLIVQNRSGIDINNSNGHTVRNNVITDNRTGLIFRNQTDNLTVVENEITNNWTVGILFLDGNAGASNNPLQQALNCTFSNNNLGGNWYGQIVDRQSSAFIPTPGTTNLKNFSANWYGTNTPVVTTANSAEPGYAAQVPFTVSGGSATPPGGQPDVAGAASANFDITPFLDASTDTNIETTLGRGTYGFQGSFNLLDVVATNAQTGATKRIQEGVDLANISGTVKVLAGTYIEDTNINKTLVVMGAGVASTTVAGAIGGIGSTFAISANNVELKNFKITRDGNTPAQWNDPNLNSVGVSIQGQAITGANIHDNLIVQNRSGIDINHSNGHTIRNNVITDNRTGLIFRNQTDNLTVVENEITNNWTVGILFLDGNAGASNNPLQQALNCTFSNNNLGGNWYGQIVDRQSSAFIPTPGTTNLKNFSANWYGTNTPVVTTANSAEPGYAAQVPFTVSGGSATPPGGQPDVAGAASANFDITPFLDASTDTNIETTLGRGTYGFQGSFTVLNVIATNSQTGATGRIQEGVNLVTPSGLVKAFAGAYVENANVNKAATLLGTPTITSSLVASVTGAAISPGFSPGIINSGNFSLVSGSTLNIELNGTMPGTGYDQLNVTGTVSLGGATLNLTSGFVPSPGNSFTIINNDGSDPVTGIFNGLPEGTTVNVGGTPMKLTYAGGANNNDVVLTVNTAPVANANSVTTNQNTPIVITLTATDVDGDNLTFMTVGSPAHGSLGSLSAPSCSGIPSTCTVTVTYTPTMGYAGADSFTFKANDGSADSNIATVSIIVAATTVFVDDNWVGQSNGATVFFPGDPNPHVFGTDAFATIQGGINAVVAPGVVNVAPGSYAENVTVNKSVSLKGAQQGVNACGRTASESTITGSGTLLTLVTGSVSSTIDGFTFSGGNRGIESTSGPINNVQILNNRFAGFTGNGVFLNDNGTDITVSQNSIDGASKVGSGDLFHLDTDSFPGFWFTSNCITGKGATDLSSGFFVDGNHNVGASGTPRNPLISGNTITSCQTGMNLGTRAFGSLTVPNTGTISNNTFSNNLFDGLQGGIQNTAITGNTFSGNGRHGLALTSFGNAGADRGGQNTTVKGNLMSGNGFAQSGAGILFSSTQAAGTISTNHANLNRIVGNATGALYTGTETIDAQNNWWGCNFGPGNGGTG
ncbi:MAG: right-handed parallel beta-helix repeat-containing protein, partial [Acidobacteriota bacterium]